MLTKKNLAFILVLLTSFAASLTSPGPDLTGLPSGANGLAAQ